MPSPAPKINIQAPVRGMVSTTDPRQLPQGAAANLLNFVKRSGRIISRPGLVPLGSGGSLLQRPLGLARYDRTSPTGPEPNQVVLGTDEGWWWLNTTTLTWTDLTLAGSSLTGTDSSQVVFRPWDHNGVTGIVGCNSKDDMRFWSGNPADDYVVITGPRPYAVATMADSVIAGGNIGGGGAPWTTADPLAVYYSAANDYSTWSTADVIRISQTPGRIVSLMEMGNRQLAIYKTDAISILVTSTSDVAPFQPTDRVISTRGPVSALAVSQVGSQGHAYLGADYAVRVFDGSITRSLGEHIQAYIKATVDLATLDQAWTAYDPELAELWVAYPSISTGLVDQAVVIDMDTEGYPMYPIRWAVELTVGMAGRITEDISIASVSTPIAEVDRSFNDFTVPRPAWIAGRADGLTVEASGADDLTAPIPLLLETPIATAPDPTTTLYVKEAEHVFERSLSTQDVRIDICVADHVSTPVCITGDHTTVDTRVPPYRTYYSRKARAFALRLTAEATQRVTWGGCAVSVRPAGHK